MKKILIVAAGYYSEIRDNLIKGASIHLEKYKGKLEYEIVYCRGSFEIPYLINKNIDKYDGFIALGCIIKGETYHFELIANECARKIMDLSVDKNKPIGFGILTCENLNQATKRSKAIPNSTKKDKGGEAAKAITSILWDQLYLKIDAI